MEGKKQEHTTRFDGLRSRGPGGFKNAVATGDLDDLEGVNDPPAFPGEVVIIRVALRRIARPRPDAGMSQGRDRAPPGGTEPVFRQVGKIVFAHKDWRRILYVFRQIFNANWNADINHLRQIMNITPNLV